MDGRPRLAIEQIFDPAKNNMGPCANQRRPHSTFVDLLVVTQQRHHVVFLQPIASL